MPDIRHLGRMATITAATVGTVLALGLSTAAAATRTTGNDPDGWYRFAVSRPAAAPTRTTGNDPDGWYRFAVSRQAAAATRTTGNGPDGWYRFAVSRQARPESSAVSPTA